MTATSDTPILRPVQGCGDDASSSRWAHCNGEGAVATLKCDGLEAEP